jgi:hypothetical protein
MQTEHPEGRVIFRMTTNPEDDITGIDDLAEEYVVIERKEAMAGLVIWGRYRDEWHCNPSARHVVKRLLEMMMRVHLQHDEALLVKLTPT